MQQETLYTVVQVRQDREGTEIFVKFPEFVAPDPQTLKWTDEKGIEHVFRSYGRLGVSSMPEGYTYWSDDRDVYDVNIISLI